MKVFKEEQKFTQPWLIILLIASIVVFIAIITNEFLKESSTMSLKEFVFVILLMIICTMPVFLFKLVTRIDEKGIYYQFFPLHLKKRLIGWKEIKNAYVREYEPISEYGGWGIKGGKLWNRKNGTAVNIKGNIGLQLELTNGKRLLIGTQKEDEVNRVIKNYLKNDN